MFIDQIECPNQRFWFPNVLPLGPAQRLPKLVPPILTPSVRSGDSVGNPTGFTNTLVSQLKSKNSNRLQCAYMYTTIRKCTFHRLAPSSSGSQISGNSYPSPYW